MINTTRNIREINIKFTKTIDNRQYKNRNFIVFFDGQ